MTEKEKPVTSPCISLCALNERGLCDGCYRTGEEISHWGAYTNDRRREVILAAHDRSKTTNPFA